MIEISRYYTDQREPEVLESGISPCAELILEFQRWIN